MDAPDLWKKCNMCKEPIAYRAKYYVCNVPTCNRKRTGLSFCSVSCWDAHLPEVRHREAWAEERTAPTKDEWQKILAGEAEPVKRKAAPKEPDEESAPRETVAPKASATNSPPKVILRRSSGS